MSAINAGIIRKDLQRIGLARAALKRFTVEQLIGLSGRAGDAFLNGTLPLGDQGHTQSRRSNTSRPSRARAACPRSWSGATWRRSISP